MKTLLIAGGTGFIGAYLEDYFSKKDYSVKILTRKPTKDNHLFWDGKTLGQWKEQLEGLDVLINLTGKSVDCRYTEINKKLILSSRVDSTTILGNAINTCQNPPKTWLNSSTATIYKHSLNKEMTEENGIIGEDFSMNVAKSWEKAFLDVENENTRKITLRIAIVLGKKGGALIPLKNITKLGLGGKQGNGNQKVSWIHELDLARSIIFLIENNTLHGAFNLSAPNPNNNKSLMLLLRKKLRIPFGLNQPKWLLKLGAKMIGTEPELVLKSRNVIPKRLLENGFRFKYNDINNALDNLLK